MPLLPTVLGVLALSAVTVGVRAAFRAPHPWSPALAILRGVLQLAAVSLVLSGVIRNPWLVAGALLVMFGVAAVTAGRRLGGSGVPLAALAMAAGVGVALTLVFVTGALAFTSRYALAIGGIVIGNAMTATTLAGRRFLESVDEHWEEVEGWFAIGADGRQATRDLARRALHSASIPAIDQTRTTGLVTLPGAFVGAIFGGVSPLEAGRFQLVVLAGLLAAGTIAGAVTIHSRADVRVRPPPLP